MELFEFISELFKKNGSWNKIPDSEKYKHSFMTYHFLSIKYPTSVNNIQIIGLGEKKTARVMDFWHLWLCNHFTSTPNWIRTRSGVKKELNILKGIKSEHIKQYMIENRFDSKQMESFQEFFPKELTLDIKNFAKSLN